MPSPTPRFTDGRNYGAYYKYVDETAIEGAELSIYTIAPENLNYFIDVAGAGLEPQTAAEVVVNQTASKGGSAKVRRYPGDDEPYNRNNVAKTVMKNRTVRHGAALPGRRFVLEEVTSDGSKGERRQFTYQGTVTALHAKLVSHLKVDARFINANGAWENIAKPAAEG